MKILKILIITIFIIFVIITNSYAITLFYLTQPGDDGPGEGFLYKLDYDVSSPGKYSAKFNIKTPGGSFLTPWYAGWFTFKFVAGDNAASIINLSFPTNSGLWSVIPPIVNIYGGTNIGQGGRSGFYVSSLNNEDGELPFPYNELIPLTTFNSETYEFTFQFQTNLNVFDDEIPFQVGFYDGLTGGGKIITERLSKTLSVPEPGILLLLGLGLSAVGIGSRYIKKIG